MNKIIYKLSYNRKGCLNRGGKALVQIEAYLNKQRKYFSTRIYLKPEQWDARKSVVKKHPNAEALNRLLHEQLVQIEGKELELWKQGRVVTLELLKDTVQSSHDTGSFLDFMRKEIEVSNIKASTRRNHQSTLKHLLAFRRHIAFNELTLDTIETFSHFLRNKGYHTNTIAKHLKHLKRYVNTAIDKGYMDIKDYAFRVYKIRTEESHHTFLSSDELHRLQTLKLDEKSAKHRQALDAFLFSCYTGIRYSDFIHLTQDNISTSNQLTWLTYKTIKTGTEVRLPLNLLFNGRAISILNRHRNDLNSFFNLKNNSNLNKELRLIARLAGLSKPFSFHTARHTYATLLLYKGVNITTVQKLLGHKSIKTTQIYTNVMDATIIADLSKHSSP